MEDPDILGRGVRLIDPAGELVRPVEIDELSEPPEAVRTRLPADDGGAAAERVEVEVGQAHNLDNLPGQATVLVAARGWLPRTLSMMSHGENGAGDAHLPVLGLDRGRCLAREGGGEGNGIGRHHENDLAHESLLRDKVFFRSFELFRSLAFNVASSHVEKPFF